MVVCQSPDPVTESAAHVILSVSHRLQQQLTSKGESSVPPVLPSYWHTWEKRRFPRNVISGHSKYKDHSEPGFQQERHKVVHQRGEVAGILTLKSLDESLTEKIDNDVFVTCHTGNVLRSYRDDSVQRSSSRKVSDLHPRVPRSRVEFQDLEQWVSCL